MNLGNLNRKVVSISVVDLIYVPIYRKVLVKVSNSIHDPTTRLLTSSIWNTVFGLKSQIESEYEFNEG